MTDITEATHWSLRITEEQFRDIYGELVDISIFQREPTDDRDLVENFLPSKLWRLNNLYLITNKDAEEMIFNMNYAQHRVYAASLRHPRLIILKSRQQGISTFWLVSFLDDTMVLRNLKSGLMAQGDAEASTLLERVKLAWNSFSPPIKEFLAIKLLKDNTSELSFSNNATLFIRNSFRSTTLQRLHISEFGKIANNTPKRAQETKTGTLQAIRPGNIVVVESTAEGDNEFRWMWDKAVIAKKRAEKTGSYAGKAFQPIFLSWLDDPDCVSDIEETPNLNQAAYFEKLEASLGITITQEQKNFWIDQYGELGDAIYQEYPATPEEAFLRVNDGSYYGPLFKKHVVKKGHVYADLYDPNIPVYVAMDLGMNDTFTLAYFQRWNEEYRIIDEFTDTGEGLAHYVAHMERTGYPISKIFCPHDITVQELGTGKSRLAVLRKLTGTPILVIPRANLLDGIERVRKEIPNIRIAESCTYLQGCLSNYSKEWDDKRMVWKAKPFHDKWSHGADTIRYMVSSHTARNETVAKRRNRPSGVVGGLAI